MFSVVVFHPSARVPVKIPVVPVSSRSKAKKVALQTLEPHFFRTVRVHKWILWRGLRRGVRVCTAVVLPAPPDPIFEDYDKYLTFLSTFHRERGLSCENVLTYLWETDQVMEIGAFKAWKKQSGENPIRYIRTPEQQQADVNEFWEESQWLKF